ncbi:MAG: hypothetical protein D6732_19390 [Methanobacteriota archaeon]|nr:MAG: hypothetical protein D6732_19390 [Euryarchaeota archaeon]
MSYEAIKDNLYQISGGFGDGGENFGAYLIKDDPAILIGISGKKLVDNLTETISDLDIGEFRVYLPNVTVTELLTIKEFRKEYKDIKIHVYKTILEEIARPRSEYLQHHFINHTKLKEIEKHLPKKIEGLVGIDRGDTLQTGKTKLLIIPFPGPHRGHTFLYSTAHKALFSGVFLSLTPLNPNFYYLDLSSSLDQYFQGLEFIQQATTEIHIPSYDQPQLLRNKPISTAYLKASIESDVDRLQQILKEEPKSFDMIVKEYRTLHPDDLFYPYSRLNFIETKITRLLDFLTKQKKIQLAGDKYHLIQ